MAFEKETTENSIREGKRLQDQAANLVDYAIPGTNLVIKYKGLCTCIDGKVRLLWSDGTRSSQACPICSAGPAEMKKRHGRFVVNHDRLGFGFSPLHCRMKVSVNRVMELQCLAKKLGFGQFTL